MIKLLINETIFYFPSKSMQNRKVLNFDEFILLSLNYSILTARIHVPENSTTHTHSHTLTHTQTHTQINTHTNKHNIRLTHTLFIISQLLYFNCSKVIKKLHQVFFLETICSTTKQNIVLERRTSLCLLYNQL